MRLAFLPDRADIGYTCSVDPRLPSGVPRRLAFAAVAIFTMSLEFCAISQNGNPRRFPVTQFKPKIGRKKEIYECL